MPDIETFIYNDGQAIDLDYALAGGGALAAEHDIKTALLISLFTDRRAEDDDRLPEPGVSKRGWWADALDRRGRRIGSRLWLLGREKQLREVLARAREYTEESLAWMIEDGIAQKIDVTATRGLEGWLVLEIALYRATGLPEKYRFDLAWRDAGKIEK